MGARMKDGYLGSVMWDYLLLAPLAALFSFAGWAVDSDGLSPEVLAPLYAGISTLAGLVLAAATFVCAMTYQEQTRVLAAYRRQHPDRLRRVWTSVMGWVFIASVLPLVSLVVMPTSGSAAAVLAATALAILVVKAVRCILWMDAVLFTRRVDAEFPIEESAPILGHREPVGTHDR